MMAGDGYHRLSGGLLILLLSLLSCTGSFARENPQERFNRGNFLLEQGEYYEALQLYRDIEQDEYSSGPLFLNMAISYAHVDSLGMSKYYFMKAQKYVNTRKTAGEGVAFVEGLLTQRRDELPRLSWISFSEWIHFEINTVYITIAGIFMINMGLIFFAMGWFYSFQQLLKYTGISSAVFGVLLIMASLIIDARTDVYSQAVMVRSQAEIRAHPVQEEDGISRIYEGYTLTLDQIRSREVEGWKYVRLSNGLNGWVEDQAIRTF